jgi:hypothetical protein
VHLVLEAARLCALAAFAFAQSASAQGGPPLVTDDPGTPGNGHVELNLSFEADRSFGGTDYDAPRADLNLGVGPRMQVKAEMPWRVAAGGRARAKAGLGNLNVGLKLRFVDGGERGMAVSTYPQVSFAGSRGAVARGVADAETSVLLPVEVAWPVGPVHLDVDAGWERADGASGFIFGLAVSRLARPWLELLGECHAEAGAELDGVGTLCGGGGRAQLGPLVTLLAAFGWGVSGPEDRRLDRRIYAGVQLRR